MFAATSATRIIPGLFEEHRTALLEIAEAWIKLEQEAEREKSSPQMSERIRVAEVAPTIASRPKKGAAHLATPTGRARGEGGWSGRLFS